MNLQSHGRLCINEPSWPRIAQKRIEKAPVINKGNYNYYIWSIAEQHPPLSPIVLTNCCKELTKNLNCSDVDVVLTAEAMGISIATIVSTLLDKPIIIGTKREKGAPNKYEAWYQCGYKMDVLNFSQIEKGSNVLIIDDVISTGSTCLAMIRVVKHFQSDVADIGVLLTRSITRD